MAMWFWVTISTIKTATPAKAAILPCQLPSSGSTLKVKYHRNQVQITMGTLDTHVDYKKILNFHANKPAAICLASAASSATSRSLIAVHDAEVGSAKCDRSSSARSWARNSAKVSEMVVKPNRWERLINKLLGSSLGCNPTPLNTIPRHCDRCGTVWCGSTTWMIYIWSSSCLHFGSWIISGCHEPK